MTDVKVLLIERGGRKAHMPQYQSEGAAAMDLCAFLPKDLVIPPGGHIKVPTGLRLQLPQHMAGLVFARSGLATGSGIALSNGVGLIDCDYRGEILVGLHNTSLVDFVVSDGDRIAQLMVMPIPTFRLIEAQALEDTDRGQHGFGSTGVR